MLVVAWTAARETRSHRDPQSVLGAPRPRTIVSPASRCGDVVDGTWGECGRYSSRTMRGSRVLSLKGGGKWNMNADGALRENKASILVSALSTGFGVVLIGGVNVLSTVVMDSPGGELVRMPLAVVSSIFFVLSL